MSRRFALQSAPGFSLSLSQYNKRTKGTAHARRAKKAATPRHLLALALGVCAGVAVMVVAARGIALSRMLYLLAGLIFAGNLFAALAFDYWSMLAARFIAGLPHGAYFGVGAIVATSLAAPGQASRDVCLMVTGMTIANLVGVPLGSFLAWSLSWRATFAVVACAALLLILALRLWMPHVPALPNKGFRAQFRFLGHLTPWLVLGAIGLGNGGSSPATATSIPSWRRSRACPPRS